MRPDVGAAEPGGGVVEYQREDKAARAARLGIFGEDLVAQRFPRAFMLVLAESGERHALVVEEAEDAFAARLERALRVFVEETIDSHFGNVDSGEDALRPRGVVGSGDRFGLRVDYHRRFAAHYQG